MKREKNEKYEFWGNDSVEEALRCLSCTHPECINCIESNRYAQSRRERPRKKAFEIRMKKVEELCRYDYSDIRIAEEIGCARSSVAECREILGIPNLFQRMKLRDGV